MRAFFAWLKHWFRDALQAAIRPKFYRTVIDRKPQAALAHLAMLALLFWVLPFSVMFFSGARDGIRAVSDGLRTRVPVGTTFELKDGKFSDTLTDPLIVRNRDFTLIVNATSSTEDLSASETGIVVNADGVIQQDGFRRQTMSFASAPPFKMTREDLQSEIARWAAPLLFLGAIFVLLAVFATFFLGFFGSAVGHAFALWLALKLFKRPWNWKRVFSAAAYAATGPIALQALLSIPDADLSAFPALYYWAFIGLIVYDVVRSSPPEKGASHERSQEAAVDRPDGDRRHPA